ncbi:MAG: hypothetical protein HY303_08310 [Candidatus Wallbacteria bacterium]|nr:hypothetical protein [Candidatus Wallbacteria bacterium]
MNVKRMLLSLLVAALATMPSQAQAYLLQNSNVVFMVKTGTNGDGTPAFRVATSNDYGAERVFQVASQSAALERTANYYGYIQQLKNQSILQQAGRYGLSDADRQTANSLLGSEPIYVEVKEGGSGIYNDWKGSFSLRDANGGAAYRIASPRVVLPLGSSEVTGGDTALLEQTLVHETGHGIMSKAYGSAALCESPYIHQSHSGGSRTDCCLSIIEGYAEFMGAYMTNRLTIANDPANSITNNLYGYRPDGTFKNAQELQATEGWVASTLYMLAAKSGIQNFMQKLGVIMVNYHPASIQALLDAFIRSYPSDAAAVRATVSKASNGQMYGDSVTGGGQVVSTLVSQYNTSLDRYVRLRYAALAGSGGGYYDNEQQWIQRAAQQEAQNLQALGSRIRSGALSSRDAGSTMVALQKTQSSYQQLYNEVQRRLNTTPFYSRQQRGQLQAEAQAVGEALNQTYGLVHSMETGPLYYTNNAGQGGGYPAAPTDTKSAYRNLVDSLKSGDREKAAAAMGAYEDARSKKPQAP